VPEHQHILKAVRTLTPLAAEVGCSLTQFYLAWVLRKPNVASAIVGATRPGQLDENAAASGLVIDPALFARAEALVAHVRLISGESRSSTELLWKRYRQPGNGSFGSEEETLGPALANY
jgi:diketogulonate reductase-like aldo/keto reductase